MNNLAKLLLLSMIVASPGMASADGHVKKIYESRCVACHGTGAAGAPKFADKASWEARKATGLDVLTTNAIKGKGAMPPKGTCGDCSDSDIKAVVKYMIDAVK